MAADHEALNATVDTLRLTQEALPARWAEDTADELLTLVHMTFHDFVVAVLAQPLPSGTPTDGPPLAPRAALHARAIVDLLTAMAIAYSKDTESEFSELDTAEAPVALTQHWIDTIAEAAQSGDRPRHDTAIDYVRGAASGLSFAARIIGVERGLSLDPDDPRGPVELPDDALTGEDAGGLLIWCASAALCISATLQPQFRIRPSTK